MFTIYTSYIRVPTPSGIRTFTLGRRYGIRSVYVRYTLGGRYTDLKEQTGAVVCQRVVQSPDEILLLGEMGAAL